MVSEARRFAWERKLLHSAASSRANDGILSADFVFATVANFVTSLGTQMLMATVPVYVLSLGGSATDAGIVAGVTAFTALLLRPLTGWLTDAWRRRPLVLIGTACFGAASLVYILAGSVQTFLFGRVVHGFGISSYTTAANTYIADIAPPGRRAEAVGIFSSAQALGLIMGPSIGFLVIDLLDFQRMFWFSVGLATAAFAVSLFARERRVRRTVERERWSPRTGILATNALDVTWTVFCMGIGFGATTAFLSIFAQARGIGNPGVYFTVQATALLLFRVFSGRVADRRGRLFVIVPGLVVVALSQAILSWAAELPLFVISAALSGLGFGMCQPASLALLVDRVRQEKRGLAASTYFTGYDAGITVGSIAMGVVSEAWGYSVMWLISATCTLCGLLSILGRRE